MSDKQAALWLRPSNAAVRNMASVVHTNSASLSPIPQVNTRNAMSTATPQSYTVGRSPNGRNAMLPQLIDASTQGRVTGFAQTEVQEMMHIAAISLGTGSMAPQTRVTGLNSGTAAMLDGPSHNIMTLSPDNSNSAMPIHPGECSGLGSCFYFQEDVLDPSSSVSHTLPADSSVSDPPSACPMADTVEGMKELLSEKLPKNQVESIYKPYIRSEADFRRQFQQYTAISSQPFGFAGDFPTNNDRLEVLAKGLTDAMINMGDVIEAGKKSVARIHQLSPYEIMMKSWQLLFDLRDIQLGQVGMPAWGGVWDGEDFDCYMDRYRDLRRKLRTCKSLVSSLFDQPFSLRVCLNPSAEFKKKIANMKNNARRGQELATIRDIKRLRMEDEAELVEMMPQDRPNKRPRTQSDVYEEQQRHENGLGQNVREQQGPGDRSRTSYENDIRNEADALSGHSPIAGYGELADNPGQIFQDVPAFNDDSTVDQDQNEQTSTRSVHEGPASDNIPTHSSTMDFGLDDFEFDERLVDFLQANNGWMLDPSSTDSFELGCGPKEN